MGAMYRLKAYFGMVPADELDEYADEPERYPSRRGTRDRDDRYEERWDDRPAYQPAYAGAYEADGRYDDEWDRRPARTAVAERVPDRIDRADRVERMERVDRVERTPARGLPAVGAGGGGPVVRGALAMDTDAVREPLRPVPVPVPEVATAPVPEQRDRGAAALARITTLQPRSYKEARTIGEHYRDGQPVIMNLTELDAADAKRLVDFAAGLAFALRGSIDKVTSRVFLLTPADVEVSADDARRLAQRSTAPGVDAERGLFRQD